MVTITDDMLRAAIEAMMPDRIQGFSTRIECTGARPTWGAPHYIRDVWKPAGEQELWRGDDHAEMVERCEMERLRLGIMAALAVGEGMRPSGSDAGETK